MNRMRLPLKTVSGTALFDRACDLVEQHVRLAKRSVVGRQLQKKDSDDVKRGFFGIIINT